MGKSEIDNVQGFVRCS